MKHRPPAISQFAHHVLVGGVRMIVAILLPTLLHGLPVQGADTTTQPSATLKEPQANLGFDIPADKSLSPEAIKALFARGQPEVYHGGQLRTVRMPIGGICTGNVYLSGEGRMVGWQMSELGMSIAQGFALRTVADGKTTVVQLNQHDFPEMTFRGEYPIAKVDYHNAAVPVQTSLEAFSPFMPLNADDSGLPATIFNFTVKNTSKVPVEVTLAGGLQNGVCGWNRFSAIGVQRNTIVRSPGMTVLDCQVVPEANPASTRPDIVFEEWDKQAYAGWAMEGAAFGSGPIPQSEVPNYWRVGGASRHFVISTSGTNKNGSLTSAPFTISRNYINLWVGGGTDGKPCVNLIVEGVPVQSHPGLRDTTFALHAFDVRALQGKQARLEFLTTAPANIGVGRVAFSDTPGDGKPLKEWADYGSMTLALLGKPAEMGIARGEIGFNGEPSDEASAPLSDTLIGALGRTVKLQPGASSSVTYIVTWHFPNLEMKKLGKVGCYYATKYPSARAVAGQVAAHFRELAGTTRLWRDTWYDSTLPFWFLDRTFLTISTLATSECDRFANGRFYAYEGAPAPNYLGTCTHVWQYAQAVGRIFPELERDTRERVDLGVALIPDTGIIGFRGEYCMGLAVDGQAGTILRFYREHEMSPDTAFLTRNWEKIKITFNPLFALDAKGEGVLDGPQNNTLDCTWFGQNSWMSSMYVAALRAGEAMANEMGDKAFASRCRTIAEHGSVNITARLFNGEYFNSRIDPVHADTMNSGDGSFIDQVYGQSWAFQLGLPRVLPGKETLGALRALWRYNFIPDAWTYANAHRPGRIFLKQGDAGMVMCSFPRTDWDIARAAGGGKNPDDFRFAKYFNETWTGQEYQVAAHMLWEGMTLEGMAMVRAIHDRYSPLKRNPWAEEEAGIHYSRAMASYGAFIGACGFEYHGPRGHIGFAPKISPENFRAPFIAAEGWGTFAQTITPHSMRAGIAMKSGQLKLRTIDLTLVNTAKAPTVRAQAGKATVPVTGAMVDGRMKLNFPSGVTIPAGQELLIEIDW